VKNRWVKSNVIQGGSPFKLIIRNMGSGIQKSMPEYAYCHPGLDPGSIFLFTNENMDTGSSPV
jgi:hypothetical protein